MTVGGVDVRAMDPHDLMERVAFVFQANRLFSQTILENVRAARPLASRDEVLAALSAAQCDDILAKLPDGVDTVYGTAGVHLSGGEVQRLMLARAILKDAPIVVLDEATAFADPENEVKIQAAFKRLARGRDGAPVPCSWWRIVFLPCEMPTRLWCLIKDMWWNRARTTSSWRRAVCTRACGPTTSRP